MRDGCHQTKPGKRERKGSATKDRKVDVKNKESMRRRETSDWNSTCEKTLPAASGCPEVGDGGRRDPECNPHQNTLKKEGNKNLVPQKSESSSSAWQNWHRKVLESWWEALLLFISYTQRFSGPEVSVPRRLFLYCWQWGIQKTHKVAFQ